MALHKPIFTSGRDLSALVRPLSFHLSNIGNILPGPCTLGVIWGTQASPLHQGLNHVVSWMPSVKSNHLHEFGSGFHSPVSEILQGVVGTALSLDSNLKEKVHKMKTFNKCLNRRNWLHGIKNSYYCSYYSCKIYVG